MPGRGLCPRHSRRHANRLGLYKPASKGLSPLGIPIIGNFNIVLDGSGHKARRPNRNSVGVVVKRLGLPIANRPLPEPSSWGSERAGGKVPFARSSRDGDGDGYCFLYIGILLLTLHVLCKSSGQNQIRNERIIESSHADEAKWCQKALTE